MHPAVGLDAIPFDARINRNQAQGHAQRFAHSHLFVALPPQEEGGGFDRGPIDDHPAVADLVQGGAPLGHLRNFIEPEEVLIDADGPIQFHQGVQREASVGGGFARADAALEAQRFAFLGGEIRRGFHQEARVAQQHSPVVHEAHHVFAA